MKKKILIGSDHVLWAVSNPGSGGRGLSFPGLTNPPVDRFPVKGKTEPVYCSHKSVDTVLGWEPDRFMYRVGPVPPGTGRPARFPPVLLTLLLPLLPPQSFYAKLGGVTMGGRVVCVGWGLKPPTHRRLWGKIWLDVTVESIEMLNEFAQLNSLLFFSSGTKQQGHTPETDMWTATCARMHVCPPPTNALHA
jgi:hypothetical protein